VHCMTANARTGGTRWAWWTLPLCLVLCTFLLAPVAASRVRRASTVTYEHSDSDSMPSPLPSPSYYAAVSHEIADAEREYTPPHQLDTDAALHMHLQKLKQNSRLNRFRQRLAAQSLVAREQKLTAHARATEVAAIKPAANSDDADADADANADADSTPNTAGSVSHISDGSGSGSDGWLARLRFATQRHRQSQSQSHSTRGGGAVAGTVAESANNGDDDVPGERLMATDEAKEQEVPYEEDKTSNFWWWNAWAPYIA